MTCCRCGHDRSRDFRTADGAGDRLGIAALFGAGRSSLIGMNGGTGRMACCRHSNSLVFQHLSADGTYHGLGITALFGTGRSDLVVFFGIPGLMAGGRQDPMHADAAFQADIFDLAGLSAGRRQRDYRMFCVILMRGIGISVPEPDKVGGLISRLLCERRPPRQVKRIPDPEGLPAAGEDRVI